MVEYVDDNTHGFNDSFGTRHGEMFKSLLAHLDEE